MSVHDYRRGKCVWNHDIVFEPLSQGRFRAYGWGKGIRAGDHILMDVQDSEVRYVVERVRYPERQSVPAGEPPDLFYAVLVFASRREVRR